MDTYDKEPKWSNNTINMHIKDVQACPSLAHVSRGVYVWENVLTNNECKDIIDLLQRTPEHNSTEYRNKRCFNWSIFSDVLCKRINWPEYVQQKTWKSAGINPAWRLVECKGGSSIKAHLDRPYVETVDRRSFYTVMVYLNDSDGATVFPGYTHVPKFGSVVIFDQDIMHHGEVNIQPKYFIRSEIMYERVNKTETMSDKEAVKLYMQAVDLNITNPLKAKQLEQDAFNLSKNFENLLYE